MADIVAAEIKTTLAVLAGGLGSRMGTPKATLRVSNEPILAFLLQRLHWSGPKMLVTAPGRTSPPGHDLFDCEAVDPVTGQGPLRGILTALQNSPGDVVVITIDMPLITAEMVYELITALGRHPNVDGLMYGSSVGDETRVEPFPAIFRNSAKDSIAKSIHDSRRSVRGLLQNPKYAVTAAPRSWPPAVWTNLNTPEDVETFEKLLGGGDNI